MLGSTRTELTLQSDDAAFSLVDAGMRIACRTARRVERRDPRVYRKVNPGAPPGYVFPDRERPPLRAPVMKIAERGAALGKGRCISYYFRWETPLDGGAEVAAHHRDSVRIRQRQGALSARGGAELALADKVSDAWLAFARTGDPNTPKLPHWPAFNAAKRPTMVFNNESKVENDPLGVQRLALWSAMGLAT